jgi:hypothetical protein
MTPRDFLLSIQSQAKTFKALPVQDYFPDVTLDIKTSPGIEEEQIAIPTGVITLSHVSGRSTWIKNLDNLGGDLKEQYLRPLFLSKIKLFEEMLISKGQGQHTLVVRAPGPDPFIAKITKDPKWKISGEIMTVVLVLESIPIRITMATAIYDRTSGYMLSNNICIGVL